MFWYFYVKDLIFVGFLSAHRESSPESRSV